MKKFNELTQNNKCEVAEKECETDINDLYKWLGIPNATEREEMRKLASADTVIRDNQEQNWMERKNNDSCPQICR